MSYQFYKILHILFLLITTSCLGIAFFAKPAPKWSKIVGGIGSLIILISGMGLVAKLGMNDFGLWPLWLKIKIGIWVALAGLGPMLSKRLTKGQGIAYIGLMSLYLLAIILVVLKP